MSERGPCIERRTLRPAFSPSRSVSSIAAGCSGYRREGGTAKGRAALPAAGQAFGAVRLDDSLRWSGVGAVVKGCGPVARPCCAPQQGATLMAEGRSHRSLAVQLPRKKTHARLRASEHLQDSQYRRFTAHAPAVRRQPQGHACVKAALLLSCFTSSAGLPANLASCKTRMARSQRKVSCKPPAERQHGRATGG